MDGSFLLVVCLVEELLAEEEPDAAKFMVWTRSAKSEARLVARDIMSESKPSKHKVFQYILYISTCISVFTSS